MSIDSIPCAANAQKLKIVNFASYQFATKGYAALSWRKLSKQVNLSSGGLSHYFSYKVELSEACLQTLKNDLSSRLESVIRATTTTSSNQLIKCSEVLQRCISDDNDIFC